MRDRPEALAGLVNELRLTTARKETSETDQLDQIKIYLRRLGAFDQRDVAAAVRGWQSPWWPNAWEDLRKAVDDAALARRQREQSSGQQEPLRQDFWHAPFGRLGMGLMIARGQCLMAEINPGVAAARFNAVLDAVGLDRAKAIADRAYHPGCDHRAVLKAIEDAAGTDVPKPKPDRAMDESDALATREGQDALRNEVAVPWLLQRRRCSPMTVAELVPQRMGAGREVAALTDANPFARTLRDMWQARLEREATLKMAHFRGETDHG